jgi:hypothetical protein
MSVSAPTTRRAAAGALIGAALSVVLAACGGSHPSPATDKTTTTTTSKSTATTVPGANLSPTFDPLRNAHKDVALLGACTQNSSGAWVLKGTIVNPGPKSIGFQIVVDFVTQPGSTVLDTQIVNVPPVRPAKTVPWQASWTYSGKNVACVVRQAQVESK